MNTKTAPQICSVCGYAPETQAKFCPECGTQFGGAQSAKLTLWSLGGILLFGAIIWSFPWLIRQRTIGDPPLETHSAGAKQHSTGALYSEPELKELKAKAEGDSTNKQNWIELSNALITRYQALEKPSSELVFALLDAAQQILKIDPKDKDSILVIADVAYDQQVFEKAEQYYSQYLTLAPDDDAIRQKYASALAFLGNYPQAKAELNAILKRDPKNFSATAYLAITAAQAGERQEALKIGQTALKLAPNNEARAKFQEFLDLVNSKSQAPAPGQVTEPAALEPVRGGSAILNAIRQSPIAGPKLVDSKEDGEKLLVYFQDFPMAAMPPFAKDKFFEGLKEAAKSQPQIKIIEFRDADTKEILDTLSLERVAK